MLSLVRTWPGARSAVATRTSWVAAGGASWTVTGAGVSPRIVKAIQAAPPPATKATRRMMMRNMKANSGETAPA